MNYGKKKKRKKKRCAPNLLDHIALNSKLEKRSTRTLEINLLNLER